MALLTLTPPDGAYFSTGSEEEHSPRVLRNDFGDGYAQRTGDGANADLGKLRFKFTCKSHDQANMLLAFFAVHKAYVPFLFTLPGETTARKWIAKNWTRSWPTESTVDVSAEFEEVADPS